jgi:hypothetical protein
MTKLSELTAQLTALAQEYKQIKLSIAAKNPPPPNSNAKLAFSPEEAQDFNAKVNKFHGIKDKTQLDEAGKILAEELKTLIPAFLEKYVKVAEGQQKQLAGVKVKADEAQKVLTTMLKGSAKKIADEEFLPPPPTCDQLYDFFVEQEEKVRTLLINQNLTQEMLKEAVMIVDTLRAKRKLAVKCEKPVQDYMDATITSLDESIDTARTANNFPNSASLDELNRLHTEAEQAIAQAENNPLMLDAAKQAFEKFNAQMQGKALSVVPESARKALEAQKKVLEDRLKKISLGTDNKLQELTALHDVAAYAIVAAENKLDAQTLKAAKEAFDKFDAECKNKIKLVQPEVEQKTLLAQKDALQTKMQTLAERAVYEVPTRIDGQAEIRWAWTVTTSHVKAGNTADKFERSANRMDVINKAFAEFHADARKEKSLLKALKKAKKKHNRLIVNNVTEAAIPIEIPFIFGKYTKKPKSTKPGEDKPITYWMLEPIRGLGAAESQDLTFSFSDPILHTNALAVQSLELTISITRKEYEQTILDFESLSTFITDNPVYGNDWLTLPSIDLSTMGEVIRNFVKEETIPAETNSFKCTLTITTDAKTGDITSVNMTELPQEFLRDLVYKKVAPTGVTIMFSHTQAKANNFLKSEIMKLK